MALARTEALNVMGVLIRAGPQALRRRVSLRSNAAAVREALRGQAGVGAVEAVEVTAAEHGGVLITVDLRVTGGIDVREAACRAIDRLHERLPAAEIRVHVSGGRASPGS